MKQSSKTFNRITMALVFLFLYAPIFLLIVFSFNQGESNAVWYNNVFDTIYGEDYEKWFEDAKVEAGVSVNKKNLNKIEA